MADITYNLYNRRLSNAIEENTVKDDDKSLKKQIKHYNKFFDKARKDIIDGAFKDLERLYDKYGDNILNDYSNRLVIEFGKKYNERTLRRIRQYYRIFKNEKWSPLATKLSWSHYSELLSIKDDNELIYSINIAYERNLSKRENKFVIEYCSGDRIAIREYELV